MIIFLPKISIPCTLSSFTDNQEYCILEFHFKTLLKMQKSSHFLVCPRKAAHFASMRRRMKFQKKLTHSFDSHMNKDKFYWSPCQLQSKCSLEMIPSSLHLCTRSKFRHWNPCAMQSQLVCNFVDLIFNKLQIYTIEFLKDVAKTLLS
jgi:hypothetical protein